jgi:hypothetical protein
VRVLVLYLFLEVTLGSTASTSSGGKLVNGGGCACVLYVAEHVPVPAYSMKGTCEAYY